MNTKTGEIYTPEEMQEIFLCNDTGKEPSGPRIAAGMRALADGALVPMRERPTFTQSTRRPPRVDPYEPCPCGSGKKFKFHSLRPDYIRREFPA